MNDVVTLRAGELCPDCSRKLSLRAMPGTGETHWHCTGCRKDWPTQELIRRKQINNSHEDRLWDSVKIKEE